MKISIVIAEGEKQVMMTPETDTERQAMKFITPTDDIEIATVWGSFDYKPQAYAYNTAKCQGGYFRRFAEADSLMFVLRPKKSQQLKDNKEI